MFCYNYLAKSLESLNGVFWAHCYLSFFGMTSLKSDAKKLLQLYLVVQNKRFIYITKFFTGFLKSAIKIFCTFCSLWNHNGESNLNWNPVLFWYSIILKYVYDYIGTLRYTLNYDLLKLYKLNWWRHTIKRYIFSS